MRDSAKTGLVAGRWRLITITGSRPIDGLTSIRGCVNMVTMSTKLVIEVVIISPA